MTGQNHATEGVQSFHIEFQFCYKAGNFICFTNAQNKAVKVGRYGIPSIDSVTRLGWSFFVIQNNFACSRSRASVFRDAGGSPWQEDWTVGIPAQKDHWHQLFLSDCKSQHWL